MDDNIVIPPGHINVKRNKRVPEIYRIVYLFSILKKGAKKRGGGGGVAGL